MSARVQPLFPISVQMQDVARQAERVARSRYDDGFLKGEVVGFTRGLQQGRKDADGFMAPVLIVGICIGATVGVLAAMAGWFV